MSQIYLAGPFFSEGANRSSSYRKSVGGKQNSQQSFYSPRHQQKAIMNYSALDGLRKHTKKIWKNRDKCRICCCYPDFEHQTIDQERLTNQ